MKKMKVKTFAYGGLGCLLISLVSFFILTKPFLYYGATQYTNITIPLNTVLVIALCFGFGLFLAHKQKTVEQIPYGMTRGQFIWMKYGPVLVIALVAWGIYICYPKIYFSLSDWLALYTGEPYDVSVWRQFLIYGVFSFTGITSYLVCYIGYIVRRSKQAVGARMASR